MDEKTAIDHIERILRRWMVFETIYPIEPGEARFNLACEIYEKIKALEKDRLHA